MSLLGEREAQVSLLQRVKKQKWKEGREGVGAREGREGGAGVREGREEGAGVREEREEGGMGGEGEVSSPHDGGRWLIGDFACKLRKGGKE